MNHNDVKEIFVYGARRCGNHALINYLLGHIVKRVPDYENCLKKQCGKNLLRKPEFIHLNKVGDTFKSKKPPLPKHVPFQIFSHENFNNLNLDKNELMYNNER